MTYAAGTNKLTKSVTKDSGTYTYTYGDSNNDHLVTKITNDNVSMNITYDAMGNSTATVLKSESSTSSKTINTTASYSADGSQLTAQTNSNGYTTAYTYETQYKTRLLTGSTDSNGTTTTYDYNLKNDRLGISYQSGVISTSFDYTCGMLTSVVRGGYIPGNTTKQNQTYSMVYDGFGNMTSIAVGSRTLASYQYGTQNKNLQSMTYGNGAKVSYTYDNLDRVTDEVWSSGQRYRYVYNSEGDLAKKLDVTNDKAVNYEYDSLGRLIHSYQTADDSIIQWTEHIYDTENRIQSQSWQFGSKTYTESYTYSTSDGSLSSMTPAVGSAISFTYDALKRLSKRANGIYTQSYTYADISNSTRTTTQVSSLSYAKVGSNSLSAFTLNYTYDNVGNIASVNSSAWSSQNATYTYDQQGQLTSETNTKGTYNYSFDTYGNIRSVSGAETHTYTYGNSDWLDLLTAYDGQSITYDAIGNPLSYYNGTRWTFTWKNGRQLATAAKSGTSVSYTYDVAGIRDSKTVGSTTYNYITQNGQVVRQTWGSNTLDIIYDNQSSPYAFVYNGTTYYYVLNLQGDVIRVVNSSGGTVASYVYDAWGRIVSSSGTMATVNPLRYRGYYYDTESGLYYLGGRYYDPVVKRFINADSAGLITANPYGLTDKNLFSYCDNNPVSRKDARGEFWNIVAGATFGALISGATQIAGNLIAGEDWYNGVIGATVSGAASGALAATGAARIVQTIGNAVISGATEAVRAYRNGTLNTRSGATAVLKAAAAGAASGFIGGHGAKHPSSEYYKAAADARRTATKVFGKKYSNPATPTKLLSRAINSVRRAKIRTTKSTSLKFFVGAAYSQLYSRAM